MNTYIKNNTRNGEAGFTLLDLAIVLLVAGFISAPMLYEYHNWKKRAAVAETRAKIADIETALDNYYFQNKHFPCPAVETIGPDTLVLPITLPQFGQENRTDPNDPTTACILPVGPVPEALKGSVPFKTLGLKESAVLDEWGRKITYAVSTLQANEATYNGGSGVITINKPESLQPNIDAEDTCQANLLDPAVTNIDLVLLSHGPNGEGAFSRDGNLVEACGATAEGENCNNDAIFLFPECNKNETTGNARYDDIFYNDYGAGFQNNAGKWNSNPTRMFERGDTSDDLTTSAGNLGINNGDPRHPVDVIGNIKASNTDITDDIADEKSGNALASTFCEADGSNCFRPDSIAGNDPDMRCGGNVMGVSGIGSNKVSCAAMPVPAFTCLGANNFVLSIEEDGTFTCMY